MAVAYKFLENGGVVVYNSVMSGWLEREMNLTEVPGNFYDVYWDTVRIRREKGVLPKNLKAGFCVSKHGGLLTILESSNPEDFTNFDIEPEGSMRTVEVYEKAEEERLRALAYVGENGYLDEPMLCF